MSTTTLDDLLKLPRERRLEYALALWESLEDADRDSSFELTPGMRAELDRRIAELDADGGGGISWEELLQRIRGRNR